MIQIIVDVRPEYTLLHACEAGVELCIGAYAANQQSRPVMMAAE